MSSTSETTTAPAAREVGGVFAIVCGAALFGTTAYFARVLPETGMAAPAITFFRFALTALVLSPFLVLRGPGLRATLWGIVGGATIALGWIGYVVAVRTLPVAEAGVLFMTYPLFAMGFAAILFGERPGARGAVAAALIVVAALVGTPIVSFGVALGAVLFGLTTPAAYGFLLNVIAHRLGTLPPLAATGSVSLGAVIGVTPLMLQLEPSEILPAEPSALGLLAAMSLFSAFMPQLIYVTFAPRLGAVTTAIAGSAELPSMFLIGWLAFGEPLTLAHAAAASLIMIAIAITPQNPPATRMHAPLHDEDAQGGAPRS
ncbi:EamA/RhaT family transporter [Acuticoccus sediminis]|uniref:EamA/RhaT family transporter n=1 Tax=Acuticoccus sediminis TaxID=2184697 RepID=A0A8B2NY01_9HYPH|nr:DMT family transporter [Acuticoccus sediminis]RAI04243.1 EamA/RhaT family transporter [Acuticoccus sediminis]